MLSSFLDERPNSEIGVIDIDEECWMTGDAVAVSFFWAFLEETNYVERRKKFSSNQKRWKKILKVSFSYFSN